MKNVLLLLVLMAISGCAIRKTPIVPRPQITLQTETYAVIQTSPDTYTVITRSKAAIGEIARRLGCDKQHACANEWDGEVFRIQRIKVNDSRAGTD